MRLIYEHCVHETNMYMNMFMDKRKSKLFDVNKYDNMSIFNRILYIHDNFGYSQYSRDYIVLYVHHENVAEYAIYILHIAQI